MFGVIRRLVLLALVSSASIVFWETSDLRSRLLPPPPQRVESAPQATAKPTTAEEQGPADSVIPGSPGQRFLIWALFVLLLPIVTAAVALRVFREQSNTANLILLFGYTALDVLAAYLVGGTRVRGLVSGIGYLIALLAVFAYNAWICSYLARLSEE